MNINYAITIITLISLLFSQALAEEVVHINISSPKNQLVIDILKLALSKSSPDTMFLIRKDEQHRFNDIKNLKHLSEFTAGQGTYWGDTSVLMENKLKVVTSTKFADLFPMLNAKRFDYFLIIP